MSAGCNADYVNTRNKNQKGSASMKESKSSEVRVEKSGKKGLSIKSHLEPGKECFKNVCVSSCPCKYRWQKREKNLSEKCL